MLSPLTWPIQTLLPGLSIIKQSGPENVKITHITQHSKEVVPGTLFVAIKGYSSDGHTFVPEALRRGASAIILQDPSYISHTSRCLFVQVPDTRLALALIASRYYQEPSRHLTLIGVTGTNGKTTLTYLLESIFNRAHIPNGVLGTINYRFGNTSIEAKTTTPDPLILQKTLREMVDQGIQTVSMEISSHALAQHRVGGCQFNVAVWTNLSQDHLDFHHTMENYFKTKMTLFTHYLRSSEKPDRYAIINIDDPYGQQLLRALPRDISLMTYGATRKADVHPENAKLTASGTHLMVKTPDDSWSFHSDLIGHHNLMNLLAAIAVGSSLKISPQDMIEGLKSIIIPGRLQRVENSLGIDILVDYAHTPDALQNVIRSVKPLVRNRLITVFGCGGNRDAKKRPLMGAIAEKLSDLVILTNDNPRNEDPERILDEIQSGLTSIPPLKSAELASAMKGYYRVQDRREAIYLAIQAASAGDVIIIAGKGHESYQIIGPKRIPFSDIEIAREGIRERERAGK